MKKYRVLSHWTQGAPLNEGDYLTKEAAELYAAELHRNNTPRVRQDYDDGQYMEAVQVIEIYPID